ncbi:FAD-binding domain-containing protein [Xylaria bambusicola]|uniref:FAD-binding domain-containing protein n=1 Tax=Xylaria bambusicola TaxID=326684 RepID=UPI002007DCC2|nr:FAD-binding domain-containing protein [Xylaria bambusicola]KAI0503112.1 FAD-binding domain-containing protein [Xylaria bambusicola]
MTSQIASELKPRLSPTAGIFGPGDEEFTGLISRWREYHAPTVAAVVQVATEGDIQEAVRYANQNGIPFFARSGGHGGTEAMALAQDALQIDFRKMNYVNVAEDGQTAKIGGGANVKEVVDALTEAGKRTVTGICESVGISAVVLGGGHGWLQGQYGLGADQIVSARLILPNGEAVTVSEDSHPDLFWAIRGAGHNFGLVAEWTFRLYDLNPRASKWSYEIFVYSGDKLEALFNLHNEMQKSQPAHAIHWCYIIRPAFLNLDHPVIWYGIVYDGPEDEARLYAKPLHDIEAMSIQAGVATTHELAALTFQDVDGPGCAYGLTSLRYPIGLKTFDVPAVRKLYDFIDKSFQETPELAGSFFVLEGYSTQAVKAVDEKSTAFPHRSDEILVTSYVQYKPDPRIDPLAEKYGKTLRQILLDASDDPEHLRAYVNYAHGDEDLREVYGWEDWRLQKLRELKAKWDPENKMRYYVPIV